MLSKPAAESSGGSSAADVDVERQQIADGVGVLGAVQAMQRRRARIRLRAAARSSCASSAAVKASRAAGAGFGAPSGGIMPVRSLRTTFSHASAWPSTCVEVQRVERETAGLRALVVTGDAVPA